MKINIELIRDRAERFHKEYLSKRKDNEEKLLKLREKFVNYYNLSFIETKLTKANYCLGDKNKNSFCYKVEYFLSGLGSAKGGFSGKFILYYSNKIKDYKSGKTYPTNTDQAFELARKSIIKIYNAAINDRIEDVEGANFWYVINYKIYWLYNPRSDIPVFKKKHIDKIIKKWNISTINTDSSKRKALFRFKNTDPVFSQMTNVEFMHFLYSPYSGLQLKENDSNQEMEHFENEDIPLEMFAGQYVNDSHFISKRITSNKIYKNTDYLELETKKRTVGMFGEFLILNDENKKLKSLGIHEKAEHSSKDVGDGLGYDITSFDKNRKPIYIEVKTTKKNEADNFYVSANEYKVANQLKDRYFIYRVFCLNKKTGKYKVRIYSFEDIDKLFKREPVNYLLTFAKG